jgi:hypothetical protein
MRRLPDVGRTCREGFFFGECTHVSW